MCRFTFIHHICSFRRHWVTLFTFITRQHHIRRSLIDLGQMLVHADWGSSFKWSKSTFETDPFMRIFFSKMSVYLTLPVAHHVPVMYHSNWVTHTRSVFLEGTLQVGVWIRSVLVGVLGWASITVYQITSCSFPPSLKYTALSLALSLSLTQCFVTSTMEDRLRTASSQEKTDVLAWMWRGVRSVRFPAKGKQRPTSVKTPIHFNLERWKLFFLLYSLGKIFSFKKKKEATDVLLIWHWTSGGRRTFWLSLSFFDFLWEQRDASSSWPSCSACDSLQISCGLQWNAHEACTLLLLNPSCRPLTGGSGDECGRGFLLLLLLLQCNYQRYS